MTQFDKREENQVEVRNGEQLIDWIASEFDLISELAGKDADGNLKDVSGNTPILEFDGLENYNREYFRRFLVVLQDIDIGINVGKGNIRMTDVKKAFELGNIDNWRTYVSQEIPRLNDTSVASNYILKAFIYHCYMYFMYTRKRIGQSVDLLCDKNKLLLRLNIFSQIATTFGGMFNG